MKQVLDTQVESNDEPNIVIMSQVYVPTNSAVATDIEGAK